MAERKTELILNKAALEGLDSGFLQHYLTRLQEYTEAGTLRLDKLNEALEKTPADISEWETADYVRQAEKIGLTCWEFQMWIGALRISKDYEKTRIMIEQAITN